MTKQQQQPPLIYTGIGARATPYHVKDKMYRLGRGLALVGAKLRSGGADGADTAFEQGCLDAGGACDIFLPWKGFNGHHSPLYGTTRDARLLAKRYHPKWHILSNGVRDLMGRNCYQILGSDLNTPCSFVVCWTPNGAITGGTGQALRMAGDLNIPVFNFAIHSEEEMNEQILQIINQE